MAKPSARDLEIVFNVFRTQMLYTVGHLCRSVEFAVADSSLREVQAQLSSMAENVRRNRTDAEKVDDGDAV